MTDLTDLIKFLVNGGNYSADLIKIFINGEEIH